MTDSSDVPVSTRVHFTHAVLQFLADEAGVRLLHIKGPALNPALLQRSEDGTPVPRQSTDADILVEPARASDFLARLTECRFRRVASFATGSPFGHAATIWADDLGYADVHRFFPGVGIPADEAFEALWADRDTMMLAGRPCAVPSLDAQRLIILLHAARGGGRGANDREVAWEGATAQERGRVRDLAGAFGAEVPLAAAIGELDRYAEAPEYDLWDQFANNPGHTRTEEWRARFRAARTVREKATVVRRSAMVNTDHLAMELGRPPSRREVAAAWFARIRRAIDERRGA